MRRRTLLSISLAAPLAPAAERSLGDPFVEVYRSPDPAKLFAYSPGIARLAGGRLVATMDHGRPSKPEALPAYDKPGEWPWRGRVFTSDDGGRRWTARAVTPLIHARPFAAGGVLYLLGHSDRLYIMRSRDEGLTWSEPFMLAATRGWHQAPCNVHFANGRVYLVMERVTDPEFKGWPVHVLAPVVMSAATGADLTQPSSWVFSNELPFREAVAAAGAPHLSGIPFFAYGPLPTPPGQPRRQMGPIGWLETNLVQFHDPDHVWHDPDARTLHLWMRAHTGLTNLACIAKAVESPDRRSITVSLEKAPSGQTMLYAPCPGGQMKFHILYDSVTRLYWLLSSQATDSMRPPGRLGEDRYGLPDNERHRLALHFSRNCMDWCFAGIVSAGPSPRQSRHYASMDIDGDDLVVLSRSGDARAASAHNGNLITFHRVADFRKLVYL